MSQGHAELDAMIARVRSVRTLAVDAAKQSAPLVQAAVRATADAGTDAYGAPWAPKKDGGRALENASAAITATAHGATVQVVLEGVEVYHHRGTASLPTRPILPTGAIPNGVRDALREGSIRAFKRATGAA